MDLGAKSNMRKVFLICEEMRKYFSYLCTYDFYGPVRNAFDSGSTNYEGKWEGVGLWEIETFFVAVLKASGR